MTRRRGVTHPLVSAALAVTAGMVAVGVAPEAMHTMLPGDAIVVEELVLPDDEHAVAPQATGRDDVANVTALLAAVRGGNTILCELAARGSMWDGNWKWEGPVTPLQTREPAVMELVRFASSSPRSREVVAPLRAALGDADACVRRFAAPLLGRTKHGDARDALVSALRDASALVREAAAVGLRFAEDRATIDPLARALEDADVSVRRAAAWALGEIEDARAIPALERALKDAEASVRINAAWALGEIEDAAAIPALTAVLRDDRDPAVRRMAAWALGHIE